MDKMIRSNNHRNIRLAVLQRVIPSYRVGLFTELTQQPEMDVKLFIGEDVPNSKVKSSKDISTINYGKSKTRFFRIGSRTLVWHSNLISQLREFAPDAILCEGESHILGYIQAMIYKLIYNRKVGLIHWCFTSLPGDPIKSLSINFYIKKFFRNFFNAFLSYSTFSRSSLVALGVDEKKIFVATNVGNVKDSLAKANTIQESKEVLRQQLGLRQAFTVLYLGTMDANKRPELLIEIAAREDAKDINFLLLGSGPELSSLQNRVARLNLTNVYLPGRIVEKLPQYCKASDVLVIPGRGGIIISEAMSYSMPVIVHLCDGTESDLIIDQVNGIKLKNGDAEDFYKAIRYLESNPTECIKMGRVGKKMIEDTFTTANMIAQIKLAATYVTVVN